MHNNILVAPDTKPDDRINVGAERASYPAGAYFLRHNLLELVDGTPIDVTSVHTSDEDNHIPPQPISYCENWWIEGINYDYSNKAILISHENFNYIQQQLNECEI